MRQRASASQNLLTDGSVGLAVGEHPWGQNNIGAPVGLINDRVFDARSCHESWRFFGERMIEH